MFHDYDIDIIKVVYKHINYQQQHKQQVYCSDQN